MYGAHGEQTAGGIGGLSEIERRLHGSKKDIRAGVDGVEAGQQRPFLRHPVRQWQGLPGQQRDRFGGKPRHRECHSCEVLDRLFQRLTVAVAV